MKQTIFLFLSSFFLLPLYAQQPPEVEWDKTFGGNYDDRAASVIQTIDGGYVVCGVTYSKGTGDGDFWVLKLNQYGEKQWGKTFGGSGGNMANSIIQTIDSGYAVCGHTWSKGAGSYDFWVLKLNKYGEKQWDKTFGGSSGDRAYSIIQTTNGGYAVCGYTRSKGAGEGDFWVLKLNQYGEKQWDKTFGGGDDDGAKSIIQTTDGGYAVCGYTSSKGAGSYDFWVLKLNQYGEKQWDKTFGGSGEDMANSIIQTTNGEYVMCGYTWSKGAGHGDFWVLKLNQYGEKQWDKTFGGSDWDRAYSIIQTTDGGYAMCGYTWSKGAGSYDFWVLKLNKYGEKQWGKVFGGSSGDRAYSIIQTTDGGYAVCGYTRSKGAGEGDFWVLKLKGDLPPKPTAPAYLIIDNIAFNDFNNNGRIDAAEKCTIIFTIENKGKGQAYNLNIKIAEQNNIQGLVFEKDFRSFKNFGSLDLSPGSKKDISIPVNSDMTLKTGQAKFRITVTEANGFDASPFEITIPTLAFQKPEVIVADHQFSSETGGKMRLGVPVSLKVAVQNTGQGTAEDVKLKFRLPGNVFSAGDDNFNIGTLQAGESKIIDFEFFANKRYSQANIPVTANITEKYGKYGSSQTMTIEVNQDLSTTSTVVVNAAPAQKPKEIKKVSLSADVDKNIPVNSEKYPNRYALIIGNEDYTTYQPTLSSESNVEFARADAQIFSQYAENVLGVPKENITLLIDAIGTSMKREITKITKTAELSGGKAEIIFFYAGHGFPDERTKEAYIMPVNVTGNDVQNGIKLSALYKQFAEANAKRVTVFLDACFSGGGRGLGLIAARAVKITPKEDYLTKGNIVIFSASSGSQKSLPYKEKKHGMFTYFLLKKLQESKGNITYNELAGYIKQQVQLQAVKNYSEQDPRVQTSDDVKDVWGEWKMR